MPVELDPSPKFAAYAHPERLVSGEWLEQRLGTPGLVVVESDEAQSLLFVNFNADDDWLVRLTGDSPEVSKNLEPLSAFGVSGWVDDDVVHGLLKVTTD